MHRSTVISFVATLGIAVPAAWHELGADIETNGKKLRTFEQSFTFDNTRVTLDVDRNLVITGDKVTATLRAFGPPRQVAIDLSVLQSDNYEGERVEQPDVEISHQKLLLTVLPDGGPVQTARVKLGKHVSRLAMTDTFKIYITQHGHRPEIKAASYDPSLDWHGDIEAGNAAAVGIMGWSGNSLQLKIVPEGAVTAKAPFVVAVHVKNTSGADLPHLPYTDLANQVSAAGFLEAEESLDVERITADGEPDTYKDFDVPLAKNAEAITRFKVTPKAGFREITFVASTDATDQEPGPVIAGAMDVETFPVTEPTPAVATAP
jgi:hypothetical protein